MILLFLNNKCLCFSLKCVEGLNVQAGFAALVINTETLFSYSLSFYNHIYFRCNICGKDFTWVGSLRSHIKIHEKGGNIQVKCHVCDRIFASKNRYERHMKYKHPPEPFVFACEPCEKTFTTASEYVQVIYTYIT